MGCFDNYITLASSVQTSRSGLYATDLPGIDTDMLTAIARSTSDTYANIWPVIYNRAVRNLISDFSKNIQDKFHLDLKLVSRITSSFLADANSNTGLAGVTLEFVLSKYSKLHIGSVEVYSNAVYAAADVINIYDTDENGDLLATLNSALVVGKNTINVDTDFEVDKVFISYNPAVFTLRQTQNKQYNSGYNYFDEIICDFCYYDAYHHGSVVQVNGGGVNVKYDVYCSVEKFVCDNLNLFRDALLYKIGYEITVERRLGERLNRFVVMIQERWDELEGFYKAQYEQNLINIVRGVDVAEDYLCFHCKRAVSVATLLP